MRFGAQVYQSTSFCPLCDFSSTIHAFPTQKNMREPYPPRNAPTGFLAGSGATASRSRADVWKVLWDGRAMAERARVERATARETAEAILMSWTESVTFGEERGYAERADTGCHEGMMKLWKFTELGPPLLLPQSLQHDIRQKQRHQRHHFKNASVLLVLAISCSSNQSQLHLKTLSYDPLRRLPIAHCTLGLFLRANSVPDL